MPLSGRVGDAVACVAGKHRVGVIGAHKVLIDSVAAVAVLEEAPGSASYLRTVLGAAPAVVRHASILLCANVGGQIGGIACEEEGTAVVIVIAQLSSCVDSFGCCFLEGRGLVNATIFVEVPPHELTLREVYRSVHDSIERYVERVGHVLQHPAAGVGLFSVQSAHILGCAYKHHGGLANHCYGNGVGGLGGVVFNGKCYRVCKVDGHVALRCYGGIVAHGNGGYELGYVGIGRHKHADGFCGLVDAAHIGAVELERQYLGLVAHGLDGPVEKHIVVLHTHGVCHGHVQLVARGEVGHGASAHLELGEGHLADVVGLGHTHGDGARGGVYGAFVLVEGQRGNVAVAVEQQV